MQKKQNYIKDNVTTVTSKRKMHFAAQTVIDCCSSTGHINIKSLVF